MQFIDIEISINPNSKSFDTKRKQKIFSDIAYVVDKKSFLKTMDRYRKKLGITNFLSDKVYEAKQSDFHLNENNIKKVIDDIRKQFLLPESFKLVIRRVLYCNKVKLSDYRVAYLKSFVDTADGKNQIEIVSHAIVFTPEARDKDILKVFQQYRDELGNTKGVEDYEYIPKLRDTPKTKPQIMIHRECYLLHHEGKKSSEIAEIIGDKYNHNYSDNGVEKAYKRYQEFLDS